MARGIDFSATMSMQMRTSEVKAALDRTNRDSLRFFGKEVVEEAKKRVPVVTGRLRDSIKVRIQKVRGKPGTFNSMITTNTKGKPLYYDPSKKRKKTRKRIKYGYGADVEIRRPYLRPALITESKEIPEIMRRFAAVEALKQARRARRAIK